VKAKQVVTNFCQIITQFEADNKQVALLMQDEYNQFYTTKFARKQKDNSGRKKKKVIPNFGQFEKEMNSVLFGFNILLQNIAPHEMIELVGELMACKIFAPLGVYCITHLQHVIKYDN